MRIINGLWRCPSIDVNMRSRDCHATDALELWMLNKRKLSGCASNLLAHEDLGHFEEAHHWNIQAKFYNEKSPTSINKTIYETHYMKNMVLLWSTNIWDSLHEEQGATLKHKCGKRIVTLPLLSFSLIFLLYFFWWASLASFFLFFYLGFFGLFFCKVRSVIPTCGGIIVSIILPSLGQCSNNDDHHTFIFLTTQQLQLDT